MARTLKLGIAVLGLLIASGCGMNGKWTLHEITPESARGHFKLASVTLNSDGTYTAESEYEGKKETSSGKYTYDKATKKLTIIPTRGESRTYEAELIEMQSKMRVKSASEHGDVIAVMKRA